MGLGLGHARRAAFPRHHGGGAGAAVRRLFASTFILCLGLELYGTTLGNWSWERDVPWVGLVTTNPPALAGAFYCALDALVLAVLSLRVVAGQRSVAVATT